MSETDPSKQGSDKGTTGARSAARLAAVQALYQLYMDPDAKLPLVVEEYKTHRLGQIVDDTEFIKADEEFFDDITRGAWTRKEELDALIEPKLNDKWVINRLEHVLHAILRVATYEIVARPDIPTGVIINEYIDVAKAFYDRPEASFVNGLLDKLAKDIRKG